MEPAQRFAERWTELERKLCRGPAWEALPDVEKEEAREYLRQNFIAYFTEQELKAPADCTA